MANPEHLRMLKQSGAAWNTWRDQYRDIRADLFKANLRGANLGHSERFLASMMDLAVECAPVMHQIGLRAGGRGVGGLRLKTWMMCHRFRTDAGIETFIPDIG
jgi:hypothetical protein